MTISLLHAFTSAVADQGSADEVGPSEWNAEHAIEMATDRVLGRITASTGAVEELTAAQIATFLDAAALTPSTIVTSGAITISASAPTFTLTDTDTNADSRISADNATGSIRFDADLNNELASSQFSWGVDGTEYLELAAGVLRPATNDATALGSTSLGFSDVHLATGSTLNFANGNAVLTHSSGVLNVSTGTFQVGGASLMTASSSNTLTNKTLDAEATGNTITNIGSSEINADIIDGFTGVTGTTGDYFLMWDATDSALKKITWADMPGAGGGISNVSEDATPQLGGELDCLGADITSIGVLTLTEQAAAEADEAAHGQVWVLTATPNVLMFTDDAGTDFTIAHNATTTLSSLSITESQISDLGTYEVVDADILRADTDDTLTAGYSTTTDNDGTKSSGTYTPASSGGNFKRIVNGGAFTLGVPATDTNIVIHVTNNGSAGAITTSSYTIVAGDTLTTTDTDEFIFYVTSINSNYYLNVVALQ